MKKIILFTFSLLLPSFGADSLSEFKPSFTPNSDQTPYDCKYRLDTHTVSTNPTPTNRAPLRHQSHAPYARHLVMEGARDAGDSSQIPFSLVMRQSLSNPKPTIIFPSPYNLLKFSEVLDFTEIEKSQKSTPSSPPPKAVSDPSPRSRPEGIEKALRGLSLPRSSCAEIPPTENASVRVHGSIWYEHEKDDSRDIKPNAAFESTSQLETDFVEIHDAAK